MEKKSRERLPLGAADPAWVDQGIRNSKNRTVFISTKQ
jgi:hypothetical protein